MAAILVFAPAILSGVLLVHVLWRQRSPSAWVLKASLGIGVGLGLRSLLYFLYLLILPARRAYIWLDLAVLACLVVVAIELKRRHLAPLQPSSTPRMLTSVQRWLFFASGVVFLISLLTTINYLLRRRQGDWDAWMMYNRAARFVHLDQERWRDSFSSQMDPIFHPDYPLLLAMNIAAGWELLGRDSASIPMAQSALMSLACLGLAAGALARASTAGQAALGIVVAWGVPVLVNEGARQMADVPMAFYILSTGVLLYLYLTRAQAGLLVLAGISAGLGAWTKNEGSVLVLASLAVVIAFARHSSPRAVLRFLAGLAVPIVVVLCFKLFLAPPGDILSTGAAGSLRQIGEVSRHGLILSYLWGELIGFGGWGIPGVGLGILPILGIYVLLFRIPIPAPARAAMGAVSALLIIQFFGYYAAYLISPYELSWHLSYSSTRIVLQLFPLALFLVLSAGRPVEDVLAPVRPAKE